MYVCVHIHNIIVYVLCALTSVIERALEAAGDIWRENNQLKNNKRKLNYNILQTVQM